MRTMVKKNISIVVIVELAILTTYLLDEVIFINVQVAFLSSLLVILGSSYSYKKMIHDKINTKEFVDERDLLDSIEDPHELYQDEQIIEKSLEDLDFKEVIKEEKAKIKTFSISSIKHGIKGSVSVFRILPYIFLILGFISLKNNELLDLAYYLPSLLIGIFVGSILSKEFVSN